MFTRLLFFILFLPVFLIAQEHSPTADTTTYYLSPVVINPTEAIERETPATFTNLSQQQIHERYSTQDVPMLLSELPSMTFYSENGNGVGYSYINLRGFDQRRLSIMVNGIPQNDPEEHNMYWIDLPDLLASTGQVQVQRGAGSAFYGPPAIGGSINLVTTPFSRKPGITFESMAGFQEFGDSSTSLALNTKKYDVSVNSGLVDNRYLFFGRLGKITSNGYRLNSWVDQNTYFLGALRIDPNMTTRFHFFGGPLTDGLSYYGLPRFANSNKILRRQNPSENLWAVDSTGTAYSYFAERRPQESETFAQPHYELIHEWHIANNLALFNTLFYYTGEGYFDYDGSWADTSMLRLGTQYGIPTTQNPANTLIRAFVGEKQWGWLPHVEFQQNEWTTTLGFELRIHRSTHWGKILFAENLPSGLDPDYHFYEFNGEKEIYSGYIHELYRPADRVTVLADVQVVHNRYGFLNEKFLGNTFSVPYTFVNPRIGINDNVTENLNSYISAGLTSREPTLTNLYSGEEAYYGATPQFHADTAGGVVRYDFSSPLAKPERLLDIEIGEGFHNGSVQLNANIYWMEFTDELVKSGQVDVFGQPVTGNADRSRHVGLEVDGSFDFASGFTVSGNFSVSRNRLIRYTVLDDQNVPVNLDGNPIAGFPDFLGNLRGTYRNESFSGSIIVKYVGPFYTDNFQNESNKNDAFTVVNAEIAYKLPQFSGMNLSLRGEARNLFNKLYFFSGEGDAFFPAAERNYLLGLTLGL